jgi:hypothetical protein
MFVSTCQPETYAGQAQIVATCGKVPSIEWRKLSFSINSNDLRDGQIDTSICGKLRGDLQWPSTLVLREQICNAMSGPWNGSRTASTAWGGAEIWGSTPTLRTGWARKTDNRIDGHLEIIESNERAQCTIVVDVTTYRVSR